MQHSFGLVPLPPSPLIPRSSLSASLMSLRAACRCHDMWSYRGRGRWSVSPGPRPLPPLSWRLHRPAPSRGVGAGGGVAPEEGGESLAARVKSSRSVCYGQLCVEPAAASSSSGTSMSPIGSLRTTMQVCLLSSGSAPLSAMLSGLGKVISRGSLAVPSRLGSRWSVPVHC